MNDLNNISENNICSDCGHENTDTAKFCAECGKNIQVDDVKENICHNCGIISPDGVKFCPECGQNLLDQNSLNKANSSSGLSGLISSKRSLTQRKGLFHKLHEDVGKAAIKAKSDFIKSVEDYTLAIESEVNETPDSYIVTIQLPNIKKEDLDIDITPRRINLKAEFDQEVQIEQGTSIIRNEIHRGSFNKDIMLRTAVIPENAEAEFDNDLLIIKLPKADIVQGHKLKL